MRDSIKKFIHRIRNLFIPAGYIVLYHRVAEANNDPHRLCVSPENFREQIKFLKENFRVVPLVQLVQEVRSKKLKNKSMALTFDDGYADNLHNALPILQEYNMPATIFLTAGYVGQYKPFYWDAPEGEILNDKAISGLGRPMTQDEAKTLSKARIIEIGGHTINHPKLAKIPQNEQIKEISEGKRIIEEIVGFPLLSFAYPFGAKDSFNKTTIELVKKAGFHCACANIHERVTNRSDIYALPRFIARNWPLLEFKKQLKKWV